MFSSRDSLKCLSNFLLGILFYISIGPVGSHGSRTLAKPCDFYWIIAKLHQEVNENEANSCMVKDAAFRDVCWRVQLATSDVFLEELYRCHVTQVWNQRRTEPANLTLNSDCRKTFRELLKTRPELGVAVFDYFDVPFDCTSNSSLSLLHGLYDGLDYELGRLEVCGGVYSAVWPSGDLDLDLGRSSALHLLLTVGDALVVDPCDSRELNDQDVQDLVVRLWHLGERNAREKILFLDSLACQKDKRLLSMFDALDVRNRFQSGHAAEGFLRLSIKDMFLYSARHNTHFLEMIVNSSVELVCSGEHLLVKSVLSNPALCRLKELVFLQAWSRVKTAPDALRILEAYDSMTDDSHSSDRQLKEACVWLTNKARLVLRSLDSKSGRKSLTNASCLASILSTLQDSSALHVLHSCHKLSVLDRTTAFEELQNCAVADSDGSSISDQVVFSCFCLICDLFQVISTSLKMEDLVEDFKMHLRPNRKSARSKSKASSASKDQGQAPAGDQLQAYYEELVTKPLLGMRERFKKLFPLNLRVEILEDAFSLLFLMHQDLSKGMRPSSWSDSSDSEREQSAAKAKARTKSFKKTSSENASSISTQDSSASSNRRPMSRRLRVGFFLNPCVIRDFLDALQSCVSDARLAFQEEKNLIVNPDAAKGKLATQRISRLSQYVSEAVWRFQLVADEQLPKDIGVFPADESLDCNSCKVNRFRFYEISSGCDVNDDDSEDGVFLQKSGRVASANSEQEPRKASQRRQSRSSLLAIGRSSLFKSSDTISKMLSQHDSLLNICLKQNDGLTKSTQVIQMFRLEATNKAAEVEFAIHYKDAVQRLSKCKSSSVAGKTAGRASSASATASPSTPEKCSGFVWDSIVQAAQAGAYAAETLIADELLASHKVPTIAEVEDLKTTAQFAAYMPHPIDWRAFVRADLALVASDCFPVCLSLLESACSTLKRKAVVYQPRGSITVIRSRSKPSMKGIAGLLDDVMPLTFADKTDKDDLMSRYFSITLPNCKAFLLQGTFPLAEGEHDKWRHTARVVDRLRHLLEAESRTWLSAVDRTPSSGSSSSAASSITVQESSKQRNRHPVHVMFNKLKKLSLVLCSLLNDESYSASSQSKKTDRPQTLQWPAYLFTIFEYVKRLSSIYPQFQTEVSLSKKDSYFSVFQHSPSIIMEHLLFDEFASPTNLDEFSKQLGLDLLQVIVQQCCAQIPVRQREAVIDTDLEESLLPAAEYRKMPLCLLEYVYNRCWIAAVIVQAIGSTATVPTAEDVSDWALVLHPVLHRLLEHRGCTAAFSTSADYVVQALSPLMPSSCIRLKLDGLMEHGEYRKALSYLDSWECRSPLFREFVEPLRDGVLSDLASGRFGSLVPPWKYVLQIRDSSRRAEIVKENYGNWPVDGVFATLDLCSFDAGLDQDERRNFNLLWRKARLYDKICTELQARSNAWLSNDPNSSSWQRAAKMSVTEPLALLSLLHDLQCFSLILEWSRLHETTLDQVKQIVNEVYSLSLLESSTVNVASIRKALERTVDPELRASIYQRLLNRARELANEAVFLQLLMDTEDFVAITPSEVAHHKIGAKILLCLPESARSDYLDLVSHPHYMIEQMLINIKIEPLQKAFQVIREDVKALSDSSPLSFASLNVLLEIYAYKSVDFRVVQTVALDVHANAAPIPILVDGKPPHVIPLVVPSKNEWVRDASVTNCMVCSLERFSMFNRRHHCRRCGRVVCGQCSGGRVCVDGYGDVPVRVCDDCNQHDAAAAESPHSLERRLKARFRGTSPDDGKDRSAALRRELSSDSAQSKRSFWKLTADACHNNTAREEFSYEQAPNISLCLSIMDLHWDQHSSGLYLLGLADDMFRLLQPVKPSRPNPEIDYSLVISMLKSVLLSAKVKFSKSCHSDGVNRCDLYLSLADLLELLVAANCKDLIPVGDLTQNDVVRRLRDRLILDERWLLALDVSTKGGLDVLGVWSAWGMACLRIGRYSVAREKFSLCLQRLKDQNKAKQINTLLKQILEQLESSKDVSRSTRTTATPLQRLRSIKEGNLKRRVEAPIGKLEAFLWDECVYYIETYGTSAHYLAFFVRYGLWEDVLRYTLDHKCPPAMFVEEVALPSLRKGALFKVLACMKSTQFSFERWTPSLSHLCRHLERHELLHALYDVQVFVKDYVRAAMTCITFYRSRAADYAELYDRLHHLAAAKQHLELYVHLVGGTFGTTRHSLGMTMSVEEVQRYLRSIKLQVEVTRFLYGKFDFGQQNLAPLESSSPYSDRMSRVSITPERNVVSSAVPTVFDDSKGRAHLVAAVILSGNAVAEGFSLANRITKEFRLHAVRVYSFVASKLVVVERTKDIPSLVACLTQSGTLPVESCDDVLLKALGVALSHGIQNPDVDAIIKLVSSTKSKIEALILCGKLKSAYLLAVKDNNAEKIQRIQIEAMRISQPSVSAICLKWLSLSKQSFKDPSAGSSSK